MADTAAEEVTAEEAVHQGVRIAEEGVLMVEVQTDRFQPVIKMDINSIILGAAGSLLTEGSRKKRLDIVFLEDMRFTIKIELKQITGHRTYL